MPGILLVLAIAALLLAFIAGPLLAIWAVNTLFLTAIPYTLKTWFAALFLLGAVKATASTKSSK